MHVALNAQLLASAQTYRAAGVSNYSWRLLAALGARAQTDSHLQLSAFVNDAGLALDGVTPIVTSLPLHRPAARIAWEQSVLPGVLRRLRPELHHGLVNVLPLASNVPAVVTVHDLSFERVPETLPPVKRRYLHYLCAASCRKARRIIAVSQQTADDVMAFYGIASDRIVVVHNGVGVEFIPPAPVTVATLRRQHDLPARYVLYLGTLEPRKNLPRLINAFAAWRARAGENGRDVALVLAGAPGWGTEEIHAAVRAAGIEEAVRFPGFVPADELPTWYGGALAFVYPSRFEGFGLPVLEAMACGTPVICSRTPSLLESAGDAALTFAPDRQDALVDCLARVIGQAALRAELRAAGLARAARASHGREPQPPPQPFTPRHSSRPRMTQLQKP